MVNPYDRCVANKVIKEKQCTIIWHMDDLKLSHMQQDVLKDIANKLNNKYGQKVPLTVHRG
jgi:ATP-dependent Clp protease adapter protein ClpS